MADGKQTRRTKGTGGVYQRASDGMWCAAVELPAEGGKRRRKVIVRAKKSDTVKQLRETQRALALSGDLATSAPTVAQWADIWWKRYAMQKLDVGTRQTYSSKIEQYIKPAIGKVRIDRLTVEHVYRLHDHIMKEKKLTASNALGTHRVLSSMFSDAEREGRVARNVVKLAEKPRIPKRAKEFLNGAEAAQVLTHAAKASPATAAMWGTSILIGKRIGEVLGITRDAVDFDAGTLTIEWQVRRVPFQHGCADMAVAGVWACGRKKGGYCPQRSLDVPADQEVSQLAGGLYRTRPKSGASHHVLPMPQHLRTLLEKHLEVATIGEHGLIFSRPDGRPHDPSQVNREWHALLAEAGIRDVDVHSLRHTCNTVLTELGASVDVRKAILGQSSTAVNEAVYTHVSDVRVAAALDQLGAMIKA